MTPRSLILLTLLGGVARPACAAVPAAKPVPAALVLLPPSSTLTVPKAIQQLLVETRVGGAYTGDLTSRARFTSSDPRVAVVDAAGRVRAVADGVVTVTAVVNGQRAQAVVCVQGATKPFRWSFANHVLPVLTKAGCNSGACHGAAAGKGGMKLTLRGYDPGADYDTLTRQALARRIDPVEPAHSLALLKATMTLPHGGGMRFKTSSPEYSRLVEWISAGSPAPRADDPKVERLEVFPAEAILKEGQAQQVLVRAVYSDGHAEDVTRWAKFGVSDDGVAGVDDDGQVTVKGQGEAAITVWYDSRVSFARVTCPSHHRPSAEVFARSERGNFVDELVVKKLAALGIVPAGPCTDEQFLRRVFLDMAGILPTVEEVEAFRADTAPDRRAKVVERLLERPEFTDYWSYKWSDLLLVSSRKLPARGMWAFSNWIRESVRQNKPWDRFVREIVTANGSSLQNGATNYYVLHKDPIDLTETTSQAFLGMSLMCARCHNHPLEKWTQSDYYGMANLFGRVRLKNGDVAGETLVFAAEDGDVAHPRLGRPMPPRPLDGSAMPLDSVEDRRVKLADWLTSPENPYFARALVNRVWRNFMGRGLVEAEDDLRLTNPASNEELLSALARDFTQHGFDVRHLIRAITGSAAYQRASTTPKGTTVDGKYYSTYIPRRLPAEVLLDTLSQVTAIPTEFAGYPRGSRALQLPDSQVGSYFLSVFGRAQRVQTCSCERQEEPNVAQALHLSNGDTINGKLRAPGGFIDTVLRERLSPSQLVERVYLRAFSRKPTDAERERVLTALHDVPTEGPARREALEDLLSAVLTSKEFLFNH